MGNHLSKPWLRTDVRTSEAALAKILNSKLRQLTKKHQDSFCLALPGIRYKHIMQVGGDEPVTENLVGKFFEDWLRIWPKATAVDILKALVISHNYNVAHELLNTAKAAEVDSNSATIAYLTKIDPYDLSELTREVNPFCKYLDQLPRGKQCSTSDDQQYNDFTRTEIFKQWLDIYPGASWTDILLPLLLRAETSQHTIIKILKYLRRKEMMLQCSEFPDIELLKHCLQDVKDDELKSLAEFLPGLSQADINSFGNCQFNRITLFEEWLELNPDAFWEFEDVITSLKKNNSFNLAQKLSNLLPSKALSPGPLHGLHGNHDYEIKEEIKSKCIKFQIILKKIFDILSYLSQAAFNMLIGKLKNEFYGLRELSIDSAILSTLHTKETLFHFLEKYTSFVDFDVLIFLMSNLSTSTGESLNIVAKLNALKPIKDSFEIRHLKYMQQSSMPVLLTSHPTTALSKTVNMSVSVHQGYRTKSMKLVNSLLQILLGKSLIFKVDIDGPLNQRADSTSKNRLHLMISIPHSSSETIYQFLHDKQPFMQMVGIFCVHVSSVGEDTKYCLMENCDVDGHYSFMEGFAKAVFENNDTVIQFLFDNMNINVDTLWLSKLDLPSFKDVTNAYQKLMPDLRQMVNFQNTGKTALMMACLCRNIHMVRKLLLELNAQPNTQTSYGWTALMYAAILGQEDIVDVLLSHHADVNIQNDDQSTALICASLVGNANIVQKLIPKANINAQMKDGRTALFIACQHDQFQIVEALFENAVERVDVSLSNVASDEDRNLIAQKLINFLTHSKRQPSSSFSTVDEDNSMYKSLFKNLLVQLDNLKRERQIRQVTSEIGIQASADGETVSYEDSFSENRHSATHNDVTYDNSGLVLKSPNVMQQSSSTEKDDYDFLSQEIRNSDDISSSEYYLCQIVSIERCFDVTVQDLEENKTKAEGCSPTVDSPNNFVTCKQEQLIFKRVSGDCETQFVPGSIINHRYRTSSAPCKVFDFTNKSEDFNQLRKGSMNTFWTIFEGFRECQDMLPALIAGPIVFALTCNLQSAHNINCSEGSLLCKECAISRILMHYNIILNFHTARLREYDQVKSHLSSCADSHAPTAIATFLTYETDDQEEDIKNINERLQQLVKETDLIKKGILEYYLDDLIAMPIKRPGSTLEVDEKIDFIRSILRLKGNSYSLNLPDSWSEVDTYLRQGCQSQDAIAYQDCLNYVKKLCSMKENELQRCLYSLHYELGTIRYFPSLDGMIITKPSKIVDAVVKIVNAIVEATREREKLRRYGSIKARDIDPFIQNCNLNKLLERQLFSLLEYYKIFRRCPMARHDVQSLEYFLPCALPFTDDVIETETDDSLLVGFKSGFVSSDIFFEMLAQIDQKLKWCIKKRTNGQLYLYRNQAIFIPQEEIDSCCEVKITKYNKYIRFQVRLCNCDDQQQLQPCTFWKIKNKLNDVLKSSLKLLNYSADHFDFGFYCLQNTCEENSVPHITITKAGKKKAYCSLTSIPQQLSEGRLKWLQNEEMSADTPYHSGMNCSEIFRNNSSTIVKTVQEPDLLSFELLSKDLIPQTIHDKIRTTKSSREEKVMDIVDTIRRTIDLDKSNFIKFFQALKECGECTSLAQDVLDAYAEI